MSQKHFMSDVDRAKQVGGNHYNSHKIQPWDIILDYDLDYWEGNVIKYVCRAKDPTKRKEDLEKAKHYLEECLRQLDAGMTRNILTP